MPLFGDNMGDYGVVILGRILKLIPLGFCACGCGQKTKIAKTTSHTKREIKGRPRKFILGHANRLRRGMDTSNWKGGKQPFGSGYIGVRMQDHPKVMKNGYIYEHIEVAERLLGKSLPVGAEIHHINGNKSDNRSCNLVICQDRKYHRLIHVRMEALKTSGHANWKKCQICAKYDSPEKLRFYCDGRNFHHRDCWNNYKKNRRG